ncbi:MAG: DinB family protein [Candidatus Promineifilaceae bacterium]
MKLSQLFSHWKQVRDDLLSTIDKFDDEELTFVPFESSMSAGQIMLHIGDAEEGWFRYVVSRVLEEWPDYDLEAYPTTEAIKDQLITVHTRTEKFLESLGLNDLERIIDMPKRDYRLSLGWIIWHVLEHEIHHRGELSLILGMFGRAGLDV